MRWMAKIGAVILAALTIVDMPAARAGDPIAVCASSAGLMRLLAKGEACKPGEQKKLFAEWEPETPEPPDEAPSTKSQLQRNVDLLAQKVAALESNERQLREQNDAAHPAAQPSRNQPATAKGGITRVAAPFEVVGKGGVVILRVAERVPSESGAGARVTIGAGDAGNYAVRVTRNGGPLVAGIGQARDGSGVAVVMDDTGDVAAGMEGASRRVYVSFGDTLKAAMTAEYKGGVVGVYEGANAVAYLTKSTSGDGGNVTLGLNNGFGVFSAGAAGDGGGEACVNRVTGGGQQRRACVGVELPSMGLGK